MGPWDTATLSICWCLVLLLLEEKYITQGVELLLDLIKPQSHVDRNGWVHSLIYWDNSVVHQRSDKPQIQSPRQTLHARRFAGLREPTGNSQRPQRVPGTSSCWDQELFKTSQSIFRNTVSPSTQGGEFRVFYATEYEDFLLLLNTLFLETILLVFMGIFPMGQHFQLRPLHK